MIYHGFGLKKMMFQNPIFEKMDEKKLPVELPEMNDMELVNLIKEK